LVTITTDVRHNNGEQECSNEASSKTLRRSTSKRMTDSSPRFSRVVSFHDEKEKAVKIEERSVTLPIFAVCPVRQYDELTLISQLQARFWSSCYNPVCTLTQRNLCQF
jgi:hypothetical protein